MRDRAQGESRRPFPRRLSGQGSGVRRRSTSSFRRAADGAMELSRAPIPPMPEHSKAVIEEMK